MATKELSWMDELQFYKFSSNQWVHYSSRTLIINAYYFYAKMDIVKLDIETVIAYSYGVK